MENEKIIVKADIRRTPKNVLIVIWYTLVAIAFCIGTFGMSTYWTEASGDKQYFFFFMQIYVKYSENDEPFYVGSLFLGILMLIGVIVLPRIMRKIADGMASQCSLSLTDKGVTGCKKGLFSTKEVKLPIDKIDAIMASNGFMDDLRGGDTLLIRSMAGGIKFPWVQNANEFVDATLAKIEEFKHSAKKENQNLISAVAKSVGANSGTSSAQKIKELKELLDSGLITQEEFEAKRRELLDKM